MRFPRTLLWLIPAFLIGGAGFFIPAYFKAVDPAVVEFAAESGPDLELIAQSLRLSGDTAAADFLLEDRQDTMGSLSSGYPLWQELLESAFQDGRTIQGAAIGPLLTQRARNESVALIVRAESIGALSLLRSFPPEPSASYPPNIRVSILPARIGGILAAYLAAERSFQPSFLARLVSWAQSREDSGVEQWNNFCRETAIWGTVAPFGALSHFFRAFEEPSRFLELSALLERRGEPARSFILRLVLTGATPDQILTFLRTYPANGAADLEVAFAMGPRGSRMLLEKQKPLRIDSLLPASISLSTWKQPLRFTYEHPSLALVVRILFLCIGSFCLLLAVSSFLPNPGDRGLARPTAFQDFLRKAILSSILAGFVLFLIEPSLLHQPEPFAPGTAATPKLSIASLTNPTANMMNAITIDNVTLLILLIFLVLQVGLYIFCLVKLSEIRRQRVNEETKLRLLDNEENLFDGGLYLGLGGTVASLIFLAVGVVEASLMAAYASTLFGIIFVSLFKIFHLRPLKRRLILDC